MSEFNIFSLEDDDDFGNLFITQEPSQVQSVISSGLNKESGENGGFLGVDERDFASPCLSLVRKEFQYSDISDDEVFDKEDSKTVGKR